MKTVEDSARTAARLLDILCRVLVAEGLPTEGITVDTHLFDDAGVDSLLLISFLLEVEAELDTVIEFEELDYADLSTIGRLTAALGSAGSRCPWPRPVLSSGPSTRNASGRALTAVPCRRWPRARRRPHSPRDSRGGA